MTELDEASSKGQALESGILQAVSIELSGPLPHPQLLRHFALTVIIVLGGIALSAFGNSIEGLVPLVIALAGLGGLFVYRELRSRSQLPEESRST